MAVIGKELDVNLLILRKLVGPDVSLSQRDIADCIGCSKALVYQIERNALRKVRKRFAQSIGIPLEEFWDTKFEQVV